MNARDLPKYHGAQVWVVLDGRRTLLRLFSEPPHDAFLAPADDNVLEDADHDPLPVQTFVLTEAEIESLSEIEPGVLNSEIEISGTPAGPQGHPDAC